MANIEYRVRMVHRGFWTYDLYFHDEGCRTEFSVGEAHSKIDATQGAKRAVQAAQEQARVESAERFGDFGRD